MVAEFKKINSRDEITKIINSAFGVDIEISGFWGYSQDDFSDISKIKKDIKSIQNMISTMRANIEMNMTLSEDKRYSSINLHEISSEKDGLFEKVEYEISAIKESDYKVFIQEYKDNFDNSNFDLENHFNKRKKATIKRRVIHWFKIK